MPNESSPVPPARPAPSPLTNLRDLGGLPVSGGRLRAGLLWRADDPSLSPDDEIDGLVRRGLTTVIDLRSPEEAAFTGRGALARTAVAYHHLPLTDRMAVPEALAIARLRGARPDDMAAWYAELFRERAPQLVQGFRIAVDAPGTTLFHCSAGKDRTGVFAAALLRVLGATHEVIADDYARTSVALDATRARLRPVVDGILGVDRPQPPAGAPALGAEAEIMSMALRRLDEAEGVVGRLRAAGLTDALHARLRRRFVD
ncbi:tyrosine-protein phosphatase [Microbacterium sp. No. 7]|uniref:tyrosine-protein phosphatase n=1 Tax=Microbacterium sp. No. 7 TaxID=1714373 RepID=UPI0006D1D737|nr:tyrosine-protein phosphatase [Microbacterium sp. No. 7]ALJ18830.1 hypothetical protein AOA12_02440 [Microbacterium sp. No. 7]